MTLESNLKQLETMITSLEQEDISLEQSVEIYGKALKKATTVISSLKTVEKKLMVYEHQKDTLISTSYPLETLEI